MVGSKDSSPPTPGVPDEYNEPIFKPFDVVELTLRASLLGSMMGLTTAAIRNSFDQKNATFLTTFTRHGYMIPQLATSLGSLAFFHSIVANVRGKDDWVAAASGSGVAGAIVALPSKKLGLVFGNSLGLAAIASLLVYTGGRLGGFKKFDEEAEFERKERLRANRRRPIEETIAELGEGRGIKPPGYEERRRQRLKEKYGIIVDPVRADVD